MKAKNIFLRALEPQDIDFIMALENDEENWRLSETLFPYSRYEIENFVLNSGNDIFTNKQLRLMIINNATNNAIGCVDLFEFNPLHRRAGIGIIISKENRQNGFATQALELISAHAFSVLGLHQLFCHIQPENKDSIHLFTKSGYIKTGVKKDWEFYEGEFREVFFFQLINL